MSDDDEVLIQAQRWSDQGKAVALATVVATWGSSPRPPGSALAVTPSKEFVGSVSGGCIEGAVIGEAMTVLRTDIPKLLDFGISDDQAWEVGLACGGKLEVLIEKMPGGDAQAVIAAERPLARCVRVEDGRWCLVGRSTHRGPLELGAESLACARRLMAENRSALEALAEGRIFIHALLAPLRMVIVGAVHISQVLAPMAALAGFTVTVIDPRRAFATTDRFPGVSLRTDWPDDALRELAPDERTAIVTLTHDPKLDDPALRVALASPAYYVGALGSRRTHAKRLARLAEAGVSKAETRRIHSPIGLPIGGRRASEIAVSILAEAIAASHPPADDSVSGAS